MSNEPSRCGETRRSTLKLEDKGSAQRLQHVEVQTSSTVRVRTEQAEVLLTEGRDYANPQRRIARQSGEGPLEQWKMPPNFNIVSSEREGTHSDELPALKV